jgi:hypothetical protein
MGKPAVAIELNAAERRELESLARAHKTGQAMARRARIVLAAAAAGLENKGDLRRGRSRRQHGVEVAAHRVIRPKPNSRAILRLSVVKLSQLLQHTGEVSKCTFVVGFALDCLFQCGSRLFQPARLPQGESGARPCSGRKTRCMSCAARPPAQPA